MTLSQSILAKVGPVANFNDLPHDTRLASRTEIYLVDGALEKLGKEKANNQPVLPPDALRAMGFAFAIYHQALFGAVEAMLSSTSSLAGWDGVPGV